MMEFSWFYGITLKNRWSKIICRNIKNYIELFFLPEAILFGLIQRVCRKIKAAFYLHLPSFQNLSSDG